MEEQEKTTFGYVRSNYNGIYPQDIINVIYTNSIGYYGHCSVKYIHLSNIYVTLHLIIFIIYSVGGSTYPQYLQYFEMVGYIWFIVTFIISLMSWNITENLAIQSLSIYSISHCLPYLIQISTFSICFK